MLERRSTDLAKIHIGFDDFSWGIITQKWPIGPYTIAEFHPWKVDGCKVLSGDSDDTKLNYHIWIDGKNAGISSDTLEGAIVAAIAQKYDGLNSQAAYYFIKMIGLSKEPKI